MASVSSPRDRLVVGWKFMSTTSSDRCGSKTSFAMVRLCVPKRF